MDFIAQYFCIVLVLLIICLVIYLYSKGGDKSQNIPRSPSGSSRRESNSSTTSSVRPDTSESAVYRRTNVPHTTPTRSNLTQTSSYPSSNKHQLESKPNPHLYRPASYKSTTYSKPIVFSETADIKKTSDNLDIKDLVDALTGAPLSFSSDLYQCTRCKVFYQDPSFRVIQSENQGRCVSCLNTSVINVTKSRQQRGRNAEVSVITLENYRQYVGHVITFEGKVHTVLISQRGKDYAVMFEDRSWTRGFKMVIFDGRVSDIGGPNYLYSLVDRKVKVRGLLVNHEKFGYEIIVSDKAMILDVQ